MILCINCMTYPKLINKDLKNNSFEYDGGDLTIGYNAEYLKDVVSHVQGKKILAEFSSPIGAALFSAETSEDHIDSLMLLMPIRLND